jgi:hypothetical protein
MNAPLSTKSTVTWISISIVAALVAALLGYVGGFNLWDVVTYHLPAGEWRQVSLAGEEAARIIGVGYMYGEIKVNFQTNQGSVYSCHGTSCQQVPSPQVPSTPPSVSMELRFTAPRPPGAVRDSLAFTYGGLCSGETRYVILHDGSAWNWQKTECCEVGCLVFYYEQYAYALGGLVVGLVVGPLVVQWYKSRHKATATVA